MTIEPTHLRPWNRGFLLVGLVAGAIAFAACGDDSDPQESAGVANAGGRGGASEKATPADDQNRQAQGEGESANENRSGEGELKGAGEGAGSPSAGNTAPGKGRTGAKDGPASKGEGESADRGPKVGGTNLPKPPGVPKPPKPPPITAKSVYEIAKGFCSDPQILEFVPEKQRDNPESIAKMAEAFAPPGMQREVYEGCLAGLRSQGL